MYHISFFNIVLLLAFIGLMIFLHKKGLGCCGKHHADEKQEKGGDCCSDKHEKSVHQKMSCSGGNHKQK